MRHRMALVTTTSVTRTLPSSNLGLLEIGLIRTICGEVTGGKRFQNFRVLDLNG